MQTKKFVLTLLGGICLGTILAVSSSIAAQGYPDGYTPSKPAEQGTTNILARFGAITAYVNDKLEAAGGANAPQCYSNCMTVQINKILECIDQKNTYAASELCEQEAAQQAAVCDPKCTDE